MSSLSAEFEQAKTKLNSLAEDPGNEAKLKIYALFKQSTAGKVATSRPGMMDFVGRAKWDAWNGLGDMSQDDAQKAYIDLVNELAGAATPEAPAAEPGTYKYITSTLDGGLRVIKFNRPAKKNAFLKESYDEVVAALKEAAECPKTVITATTGAGDFYSSDLVLSSIFGEYPSRSLGSQAGYQMLALIITLIISISSGALTGFIASKVAPFPVHQFDDKCHFEGAEYEELGSAAEMQPLKSVAVNISSNDEAKAAPIKAPKVAEAPEAEPLKKEEPAAAAGEAPAPAAIAH